MIQHDPSTRSATALILDELQLFGHRPFADEPDPRPLPEATAVEGAMTDIFDALVVALGDTRLEPDLEDLLWSTVNVFHRMAAKVDRTLDDNEQAQKRSQRSQDGSEVRSVELEQLTAEGITLVESRNAYEGMRDLAADLFETHLGQTWHPHTGSRVNRKHMTAAMIDSRNYLDAKRKSDLEPLMPTGTKIAFTGGQDVTNTGAIWTALLISAEN